MSKHAARSFWGPAAVATIAGITVLILGGITGLWIAVDVLNGSLGAPLWAVRHELLLALIAADAVFMVRVIRLYRLRGQR